LNDPAVATVCKRLYGADVTDLAWNDPGDVATAIVTKRFFAPPAAGFTEFTMVAPGLAQESPSRTDPASAASALEERRAFFNLIDGDLRCMVKRDGVERAVLRWEPVHRTVRTRTLQHLITLRNHLAAAGEHHAANFAWDPHRHWIYWPHLRGPFICVTEESNGKIWMETWAEWLTEGLADLKLKRKQSQRDLGERLCAHGIEQNGNELCALLSGTDVRSAACLVREFYGLVTELGFDDRFRWHRRPTN
jgi:hypothetical protein